MKKILTLLFVFNSLLAFGQDDHAPAFRWPDKGASIAWQADQLNHQPAKRGTDAGERVVARVVTGNNWWGLYDIADSVVYRYNSPDRGMNFSGDKLSAYFDNGGGVQGATILSDTVYGYFFSTNTGAKLSYRAYNSDNDIVQAEFSPEIDWEYTLATYQAPGQCTLERYYYLDSAGNSRLTGTSAHQWNGGVLVQDSLIYLSSGDYRKQLYTYDTNQLLTSFTDQEWSNGAAAWDNGFYYDYERNSAGQIVEQRTGHWDTASHSWTVDAIDSMSYGGPAGSYTNHKYYLWSVDSGRLLLLSEEQCHLNAAGLHDTIYFTDYTHTWESYSYKAVFTYTAYNHIRTYDEYIKDTTGRYSDSAFKSARFYYELHGQPSGIASVPTDPLWKLYPNPAGHDLIVERISGNSLATLQLTDATGRVVVRQALPASGRQLVRLNGLAAGLYFYQVRDEAGRMVQGKLMKQ